MVTTGFFLFTSVHNVLHETLGSFEHAGCFRTVTRSQWNSDTGHILKNHLKSCSVIIAYTIGWCRCGAFNINNTYKYILIHQCSLLNPEHHGFHTYCELWDKNPPDCVDVAVLSVLHGGGTRIQGGEKLWGALGDLWLIVGLEERILKTELPERHLFHSWALLPISLQHLPSPLSYKSQWPLLFQSPLREERLQGVCWQWILMLYWLSLNNE